jgi:hypothetical protein
MKAWTSRVLANRLRFAKIEKKKVNKKENDHTVKSQNNST